MQAFASVNDKLSQNVFRRVLGTKVVSELLPAGDYFIAEPYHQRYLERGGRFGSPQNASKVAPRCGRRCGGHRQAADLALRCRREQRKRSGVTARCMCFARLLQQPGADARTLAMLDSFGDQSIRAG